MAMVPFFRIAGDHALRETRSVTVPEGMDLPADEYGFIEFYCDDPKCDCRRVIFQVWRKSTQNKVWATITYGWDTPEYYANWYHGGPGAEADEMASAILEQLSPQTELSDAILELCKTRLLSDPDYVARLKRHYQEACPRNGERVISALNKRRLRRMKERERRR